MAWVKSPRTHAEGVAQRQEPDAWTAYVQALANNLHRARIAKGLSQEGLAHEAGITRFTYQKLEKGESNPGKPANPSLRLVMALAAVLGVELAELLPPGNPEAR